MQTSYARRSAIIIVPSHAQLFIPRTRIYVRVSDLETRGMRERNVLRTRIADNMLKILEFARRRASANGSDEHTEIKAIATSSKVLY